ncbi:MAG: maltose alpha-D-glucosyltransferase [Rhodospirillales bacterium]
MSDQGASATDRRWYQDVVIYQVHVKAFYDANADGIGDFRGLTEKLDYLSHLGVTAVWLLPFYPSPLRDDGYDIADYCGVHPSYGTMRDFRRFLNEAHRRGLRVITELVINHTSDQHRWFRRARSAKPGSTARNYYVWSDTDRKFAETRIIFCDTEKSNWTWDEEAKAYYWHRFFSHQPDLNFDNPRVFDQITRTMRFWLEMGVDGLRLDAIPYLCEREGTSNENLPETHDVIRRLRAWLDANYPDRMFLAEANQWPEDVRPYFGDGDECHMAFHFPLMPRIYMALAREDRYPITDILRQTPEIPETCQWAVFLRNHDELTLEMVSARERDYLWTFYAADPHARINLGIRRRLAPLLGGDRRKIELLTSLLLTLTGTPVLYYGDEIGMGDNIYLGDRNGVRTPMQWSSDRNGGFSRADPQQLFLPPIMDPVYGYSAVNVETQLRQPSSLLNWTRRAVMARNEHCALGRGTTRLLYPRNRKILAYLRECPDEVVLCVANLASSPQASELDLSEFKGRVPVEIFSRSSFPPIGTLPYFITLPGHGFYGLVLAEEAEAPSWHEPYVSAMPEFRTLVVSRDWPEILTGRAREILADRVLPEYLRLQRWYADKQGGPSTAIVADWIHLGVEESDCVLAFVDVANEGEAFQRYSLPFAVVWETEEDDPLSRLHPHVLARVRRAARFGVLYDGTLSGDLPNLIVAAMREGQEAATAEGGTLVFRPTAALAEFDDLVATNCRRLGGEQSNTSLLVDDRVILKLYRRLQAGVHPEVEIGRFLTDVAHYANAPRLLGSVELVGGDGSVTAVALLQEFVRNQGDGWTLTLDHLDRALNEDELMRAARDVTFDVDDVHEGYWLLVETLARRIGELHRAFALDVADPNFAPEATTAADSEAWSHQIAELAAKARDVLHLAVRSGTMNEGAKATAERLLAGWSAIEQRCMLTASSLAGTVKTRIHGDLHLGQVVVAGADFRILDFEGEPLHALERRRAKASPLRDIAGMIRSFDYAGNASLIRRQTAASGDDEAAAQRTAITRWWSGTTARFVAAYRVAVTGCPSIPPSDAAFEAVLEASVLEKALYEVWYEAANRPDWLGIPLAGVLRIVEGDSAS